MHKCPMLSSQHVYRKTRLQFSSLSNAVEPLYRADGPRSGFCPSSALNNGPHRVTCFNLLINPYFNMGTLELD